MLKELEKKKLYLLKRDNEGEIYKDKKMRKEKKKDLQSEYMNEV